jgi:uncharacterized membrane protein
MFFERPFSAGLLILTPVLTYLMWRRSNRLRKQFGTTD